MPSLEFDGPDLDRWIDELSRHAPDLAKDSARHQLYSIAISHLCGHERGPEAFTRKQARDGLNAFLKHPTAQAVAQLNGGAEIALIDALWSLAPLDEVGVGDSIEQALFERRIKQATLKSAAHIALETLSTPPKKRDGSAAKGQGRPRHYTLEWTVAELCKFWEMTVRRPVTASNLSGANYSQECTSPAGAWVTRILTDLGAHPFPALISREIARYVRRRKIENSS
ncbi:hypothetical protein RMQ97_14520 [Maricaulis sp. D1M11]|uniref:hypothetical protein n=1 Tax=Maricaulis sp. D1M11 TaxID=3076117 RepID=UPI0039B6C79B